MNKTFKFIVTNLLHNKINELEYVTHVNKLLGTHVWGNVKSLLRLLKERDFFIAYKYTLICYIYNYTQQKLKSNMTTINKMKNCANSCHIENELLYIQSFNENFSNNDANQIDNINCKSALSVQHVRDEIIDRLKKIVKRYGIIFLNEIGIEIKSSCEFNILQSNKIYELNNITKYYNNVIKQLHQFFDDTITTTLSYNEIDHIYHKIISNVDPKTFLLNVSKYEKIFDQIKY